MMQIDNTLVSEDLLGKEFVCNLTQCKGACCVEGEAGAPLTEQETKWLDRDIDQILPFIPEKGQKAIAAQGRFIKGWDGDWETPIIEGKECVYTVFDTKGNASCGIEKAFLAGKIDWKKPVSCHLYPVRVQHYSAFVAVNYHQWEICNDACALGAELSVPIYVFVKDALVRKFGQDWYDALALEAQKRSH